uniref:Uncharacterized protein n=1 Tax=Nelumbo nucifera TaxID=4432 RepID=A0A822ZI33_NELNU|nr:TPA_asm: hypothetical protein HUJ06_001355 [Nelumbo nucifera]
MQLQLFRWSYSHVMEKDVVGFEEDMKILLNRLIHKEEQSLHLLWNLSQ